MQVRAAWSQVRGGQPHGRVVTVFRLSDEVPRDDMRIGGLIREDFLYQRFPTMPGEPVETSQ